MFATRRAIMQSRASLIPPGNLWASPIDFTNTAWGLTSTSLVPGFTAPDGSATAFKIMEDGASAFHDLYGVAAIPSGVTYDVQFYLKSLGLARYVGLSGMGLSGGDECPIFNPDNGSIDFGATSVRIINGSGASMQLTSNGWWRCKARVTATNTNAPIFAMTNSATANTMTAWQGNGSSGILIWGAHYRQA
jgi:hypothetical protein